MSSRSRMTIEYPIYCLVCGDDGDSSSTSMELGSRAQTFQCFLKLFSAKWRGKAFSFCEECRIQLTLISELQRELQQLQHRLKECGEGLETKLERSEATFEKRSLYSRDSRYFKIRKQILGDKISQPEPQPADYLNGRKVPAQLVQSVLDKDIKEELEELQENTELNQDDGDDIDDKEQVEESDRQPHQNEDSFQNLTTTENSPESHQQHRRRSQRKAKRKIVIDQVSEENEEGTQETILPSLSRRSERTKRKRANSDSESEEEFIPVEKKTESLKNQKISHKLQVSEDKKIIILHNIKLIRISEVEESQYKCSECNAILPNKEHFLRGHVVKEHTTIYECSTCLQRFGQSSHLKRHIEISHRKTTTPQFSCPICSRPFFRADTIKSHVWSHYSEQDKAEVMARGEKLPKRLSNKNRFPCEQCSNTFSSRKDLDKHCKAKHGDENGEKELCGLCGARVVNVKHHMRFKHTAEEDKMFECAICKRRFVHNHLLITHRTSAHSDDKPFKCNVCGRDYKFLKKLKEHRLVHEEVKAFSCHICGIRFFKKEVMNRHIATIHEGKKRTDSKKKSN